jgi:ATP-binding cassette subfamily F protein 3
VIELKKLALRRGTKILFAEATATIARGMRVGIVGRNGSGKTSLFAAILGTLPPDEGDLEVPRNLAIAHVAQHTPSGQRSARDAVLDGDTELRAVEAALARAEAKEDGDAIARAHTQLDDVDGYSAPSRAERILTGLGFGEDEFHNPLDSFSGGWRMRLNLAQALMARSDLLLLDEPTNHLDLDAVLWLERWLSQYAGTLILISHDRDFLDRVTTNILHIDGTAVRFYTGNFSQFEAQRAEKLLRDQALATSQARRRAEMQGFVDRFRAKASKAKQAQSRLKALERMDAIEVAHPDRPFRFVIGAPDKLPEPLLRLDRVAAGYGENIVIAGVNLSLSPGSRIGLVGHNGAGKSTLIKLLAGMLDPLDGDLVSSKGIETGYFAQHQLEQLDGRDTPLTALARVATTATQQQLRDYLGGFGFPGAMADAVTERFSGGERARLVLAVLLWRKPNLLLLDEPTNHLDLDMRDALARALQSFSGALVTVSHDRHLLSSTTDELWLVHRGKVEPFKGDLDDYRDWLLDSASRRPAIEPGEASSATANAPALRDRKAERQQEAATRARRQPLKKEADKLERELENFGQLLSALEARLADSALYDDAHRDELRELLRDQATLKGNVETTETRWLEVCEEMETM